MQQALDALSRSDYLSWRFIAPLIEALRERLAQPDDEPVGEVLNERGEVDYIRYVPEPGTLLYTRPQPASQWRGLTDEELEKVFPAIATYHEANKTLYRSIARAIEKALKEKNT